jgi:arylformamidase
VAAKQWIDITVPLREGMAHWPGDPPFTIKRVQDMAHGDAVNLSAVQMGVHSGTHLDAPRHFLKDGRGIEALPLDVMAGRARVIQIEDNAAVTAAELEPHRIRRGERILFKTRNSSSAWQTDSFVEDFVYIADDAADLLAESGAALVGIDYLSVGSFKLGGAYVHQRLLGAGIWIIEGLDLSAAAPGNYEMACLPLRLADAEGAPARVIIRPA